MILVSETDFFFLCQHTHTLKRDLHRDRMATRFFPIMSSFFFLGFIPTYLLITRTAFDDKKVLRLTR